MTEKKLYQRCFVPYCQNSAKNAPDKVFLSVPEDEKRRKLWFDLARRSDKPSKSNFYCCQDHFNLEEDLLNYTRFKIYGGYLKLKKDTVPRFFDCQPDRKAAKIPKPRSALKKLVHKRSVAEILNESEVNKENDTLKKLKIQFEPPKRILCSNINVQASPSHSRSSLRDVSNSSDILDINEIENVISNCESAQNITIPSKCVSPVAMREDTLRPIVTCEDKAIQVRCLYRSKSVSCNIVKPVVDSSCSPIKKTVVDTACSPILFKSSKKMAKAVATESSSTSILITSSSEYEPLSDEEREAEMEAKSNAQMKIINMTNYFVNYNPKMHVGILNEWLWIINVLSIETKVCSDYIKLTLVKIKLNDTFERLSEQFGISVNHACRIFNSTVPKIAFYLKKLIFFPTKQSIKRALPIPFRANYSHVQSIVDCFEISIHKPSNPVDQALTWSSYKGHNTIKYLISSTPDGFINFISVGYGGRISDILLFEKCDILDKLPAECGVMADRGFKGIQTLLLKKNCELIRSPSVSTNAKLSKDEALETKRIASLRIHIERVIRRLREFSMLQPCANLSSNYIKHLDSIVVIAAALSNLQSPIIKT